MFLKIVFLIKFADTCIYKFAYRSTSYWLFCKWLIKKKTWSTVLFSAIYLKNLTSEFPTLNLSQFFFYTSLLLSTRLICQFICFLAGPNSIQLIYHARNVPGPVYMCSSESVGVTTPNYLLSNHYQNQSLVNTLGLRYFVF